MIVSADWLCAVEIAAVDLTCQVMDALGLSTDITVAGYPGGPVGVHLDPDQDVDSGTAAVILSQLGITSFQEHAIDDKEWLLSGKLSGVVWTFAHTGQPLTPTTTTDGETDLRPWSRSLPISGGVAALRVIADDAA
jgi:hypothetical protein